MNSEQWDELPEGWRWAELAQVAEIGSEQIVPKRRPDEFFNYVALENVEPCTGRLVDFAPTYGTKIASNKYKFTTEHVLYGKLRPYLQKALVPDFEGVSATDLLPLKPHPEVLDRRYLWRWLLSYDVLEYVTARQTGVKMPRLRTGDLESLPVPLPPLPEQRRIVEKLERLLAESRAAREALGRIPALLKQFRQAVLAKAFRGELTERNPDDEPASALLDRIRAERRRKWEASKKKYLEPAPPDTRDLPELPEGWVWVRFENLLDELKNGYFSKTPALEPPGIPILRISAVRPLSVNLNEPRYLQEDRAKVVQYQLNNGDLLFTRYNGSLELVGVCGMVRELEMPTIYPDKLIRARLFAGCVLPEYLELYFATQVPRNIIEDKAKSSAGQQGISGKDLKNVPVALASLAEQRRIVAKIESLFAQAEAIERAAAAARRRARTVDQAVLARAFRGAL